MHVIANLRSKSIESTYNKAIETENGCLTYCLCIIEIINLNLDDY